MKNNMGFLGDVLQEFEELQKLEVSDVPEESRISAGAGLFTLFCC